MLIHAADWMSLSKHNKHRKDAGCSIWTFDAAGEQDTENSSLQVLQQQVLPLLELPTLLECVIQDFLSRSHKKKAKQKFKVLF